MARYKRGNTVLNWLYSYIHSSTQLPPLSGTIILSLVSLGDFSSVLLISFYALLLFYTFTCLKVSKHVSNNLKILANWGRFLSIQRHPNSGYFGKCHHFLPCHVQQQQKKSASLVFILMSTLLFMPGDKIMSSQQNCPSNYSHMSFTKSLRNVSYSFRGIYRGMQISYHCFLAFAKRQHVK